MTPRPFEPDDVVTLRPAATRFLGAGLLVSVDGAAGSVEALVGTGPELYTAFSHQMTIAETAASIADSSGESVTDIQPQVIEFAERLVATNLAEPAS